MQRPLTLPPFLIPKTYTPLYTPTQYLTKQQSLNFVLIEDCTCVRSFSFSSNSSSLRGSASSILSCSSFCACAAFGRSGFRGT